MQSNVQCFPRFVLKILSFVNGERDKCPADIGKIVFILQINFSKRLDIQDENKLYSFKLTHFKPIPTRGFGYMVFETLLSQVYLVLLSQYRYRSILFLLKFWQLVFTYKFTLFF